jgi:hypothetical protein
MNQISAIWGFGGVCLLIVSAILRMSEHGLEALAVYESFTATQWALLVSMLPYMAYSEGYKGFQKRFSPRLAARVAYVAEHGSFLQRLFAPVFCMGYFAINKREMIITYALTIMIMGFIVGFKYMPQPWRGIADMGVVVGLVYGIVTMFYCIWKRFTDTQFRPDPCVPNFTEQSA